MSTTDHWRTSSFSGANGSCVEVASHPNGDHAVRDTKDHGTGATMRFTATTWQAFIAGVKAGEFD